MDKISINMLSKADDIPGQGVGSAYVEQVSLLKEGAVDLFDINVNSGKVYDIQHHHTINIGNYLKLKRKGSINVAYVHFLPHTLDGSIKVPKIGFDVFKKYLINFYSSADVLVVVNPIFIKDLMKYGIERERIYYIPNYVSKENFYQQDDLTIRVTKQKYGFSLDQKIVLGVGQVQHRKGVLDFVEVAKSLPDTLFVWCGGFSFGHITDGYKELKAIVENPPANVKFIGIVDREEMNYLYNAADILFMPSYNELFPMAILEAVNSNKPLLLRDLELYEDILFKKYLKADDNSAFIAKIQELLDDPVLYQEYSDYAKEINEYYTKENVLELWRDFYCEIYEKYHFELKKVKRTV